MTTSGYPNTMKTTPDWVSGASGPRGSTRVWVRATLWAVLRIWVGWQFLTAALVKIGDPAWTGAHAGVAVRGFLGFAISPMMTGGPHPNVLAPYAWLTKTVLLTQTPTLSYLVTAGEFLVGAALILGLGTRLAALGGVFLNAVYMFSGSAGLNVPMFAIGLSIVLVGTMAGLIGLDSVALPYLKAWIARLRSRHGGGSGGAQQRRPAVS